MKRCGICSAAVLCSLVLALFATVCGAEAPVSVPNLGMKVSEAYVRALARDAYFWGWPMTDIYNRRLFFGTIKEPSLQDGIVPVAPLNHHSMLSDYINPAERAVACPNQDVVYGAGLLALDRDAVVVQVPDFGKRFWVYQVVDVRTDSFAELGAMYGTKPGFYLLVGPDWKGTVPKEIAGVFRAKTDTGMIIPRVFQSDSPADKKAIQPLIEKIDAYPLSEFTGKVKTHDWRKLPSVSSGEGPQKGETKWVIPEKFYDELGAVLKDARPLPGEEAMYAQFSWLAELAKADSAMREIMIDEAKKADEEMIAPLLRLSSFGLPLAHYWGTIDNGAAFGVDYFTRTAVARSNILVNKQNETKYFYQDVDSEGNQLNGSKSYTVTFPKEAVPVNGFWSLTLYDKYHFFVPNALNRYSLGTKNVNLKRNHDGTLTLHVGPTQPRGMESNWLPAPKDADFALYIRAYWPKAEALDGRWTPPAVLVAQ